MLSYLPIDDATPKSDHLMQRGAETLGYEFEALAIYDLMRYVKPPVSTLCVGNAFGEAAMLLAAGEKVHSHPHHLIASPDCGYYLQI